MKLFHIKLELQGIGRKFFYYSTLGVAAQGLVVWALKLWETDLYIPFCYFSGDASGFLVAIKTIQEYGWWWFNPNLAAPFSLALISVPVCMNTDFSFIWLITRFVSDPCMAMNIAYLLTFPICAIVCAYALKKLGVNSALAWGAALLYAFLPYHFYRNVSHFNVGYYFVPVSCMFAIILASGQVSRITRYLFAGVVVFLVFIGFNFGYTTFFAAFNLLVGLLIGSIKNHSRQFLKYGVGALAILCIAFVINHAPSLLYQRTHEMDKAGMGAKSVSEVEILGLKIRHLVSPILQTSIPGLKTWAKKDREANFPGENENVGARLGSLMALGFIGLLLVLFFNVGEKWGVDATDILSAARLNLACVLLATIGGFGSIFNLLITPEIRAYNRISPFIAFYALFGLAWGVTHLGRRFHEKYVAFWQRVLWGALLVVLLAFGLYDQSQPASDVTGSYRDSAETYKGTKGVLKKLEREYPSGTMFLQMPLLRSPYNVYITNQGYLYIQAAKSFRWSYGIYSNSQERWAAELESLPVDKFVQRVVAEGFKAIIFYNGLHGFNESSVTEMNLGKLTGIKPWISPDGKYSVFDLRKERSKEIAAVMKVLALPAATIEEKSRKREELGKIYAESGAIELAIEEYRLEADRGVNGALTSLERLCARDGGKYRGERGCPKPDAREAYEIEMLEDFEGRKEPAFFQWGPNNAKHAALTHGLESKTVYRGKQAERLAVEYVGYEEGKTTEYWMLSVNVPLTRATHLSCMTRGSRGMVMVMIVQFAGEHYEVLWYRGRESDLDRKYQLEEWRAGDMDWEMQVSEDVYAWAKKTAAEKKLCMAGAQIVLVGLPAMSLNQNDVAIDNVQAWFKIDLAAKKQVAAEKVLASDSASVEEKARALRELDKLGATYEMEGQIERAIREYRLAADRGVNGALTSLERLCATDGGKYRGERGCPKPDAREAYEIEMLEDFEGRKEPAFFQWGPNNAKHAALTHTLEIKNIYRGKQAERLAVQYAGYKKGKTTEYWMLNVNVPLTRATHLSCMTRGSRGVGMVIIVQFTGEQFGDVLNTYLRDRGSDLDSKYQLEEWRAGDLDWQMNVSEDVYAWAKKTAAEKKFSMDGARIVLVGLSAMSLNQNDVAIDNVQAWSVR